MFKTMCETVSVGMVVADMNVPGCPLAYINEGFQQVTGEGTQLRGSRTRTISFCSTLSRFLMQSFVHTVPVSLSQSMFAQSTGEAPHA